MINDHQLPIYFLSLALLTGCATSFSESQNDLPAVQAKVPDDWSQDTLSGLLSGDWIKDFEDSNLEYMIETAFAQNPSLQAAFFRVQRAEAEAVLSGALKYPSLSLGLSANKQKQLFDPFGSFDTKRYGLTLASRWELDIWGKVRDRQKATLALLEASGYDMDALQLSLLSQICKVWFNAKEVLYQRDLTVRSAESFDSNLKILEDRYQRGLIQAFDLRLFRSQAAVVRSQANLVETTFEETIRLLETLLGNYPGRNIEITKDLPAASTPIPAGLPASLLNNRPDVRAAERRLAALGANFDLTKKNRFPDIILTGNYGTASSELDEFLDEDKTVWSLAGDITAPLFRGGQLSAERKLAEARFNEQLSNYESAILNAFREVETALANQDYLVRLVDDLSLASNQSAKALDQAWDLYGRGLIDITEVLDAERRSFDAQRGSISAISLVLKNRVDLYVALGGGFNLDDE
tara:strand:+ start:865 stop:2262 length:1398 start_codon:yes stop_codon:yes gene_type:complete